ncbi:hypothetical protein EVC29_102 [Rhizobium phage RHph_Y52]|nr:hypothetical protein EVC03_107 [Rhizobium phage RHph_Y5A]QIG75331.1 hypothetical protein EVC16_102 [Rhizobium phage RHph_Y21]QIG75549.1 hypothetical protein EVC18_107 [Rhizobium phage RHph_Y2_4]QIG76803.1 hypothetical protein EVC29_102 [Rhizobium phage RHph_Y52]
MRETLIVVAGAKFVTLAGRAIRHVPMDDLAERVTRDAREILQMREAEPTEDPRPDPRRSRITARGGRSDDWKGRYRFG